MDYTKIDDIDLRDIPKITDPRGNLSVIEGDLLPYAVQRVYYLYDVPSDAYRGGHSHKEQQEFLIALSGSFEVILDDGENKKAITLNKPNKGLLIPTGIWRELENFSSGAVCLVLSSGKFLESDYIREYEDFKLFKGA
ncbi:sugar 3,4-ketoisomerase [Aequorivita lipolytica]|uniref:WxcM-like domain-containing protein n=1 Tax=Aequorivita lipolytica TaxID=153267 RepID=A0A5C6YNX6_9FLAO|nr:FdtA/QdtA family cupin domain-containing protein [Aequorivita lipolytica]TXD69009.1 WxcM-like domain-containing protein [Aequorivita lipolytica]SRX52955.1 TDP-4-oxo-6-deoxy-alpha-D-glucose-3, 4-oxoisomerase [Aequorivita lipolytica]